MGKVKICNIEIVLHRSKFRRSSRCKVAMLWLELLMFAAAILVYVLFRGYDVRSDPRDFESILNPIHISLFLSYFFGFHSGVIRLLRQKRQKRKDNAISCEPVYVLTSQIHIVPEMSR